MINRQRAVLWGFFGYKIKYYGEFNCLNLIYCDHFSHLLLINDDHHNDFILCQKSS